MTLVALITELLALAAPTAKAIRSAIAGRDLSPAVHTINVRDDAIGHGTYVELVINEAARVRDLAPLVTDLKPAPRTPGDSLSGTKLATEVIRGSGTVRVVVELAPRSSERIAYVTIHYRV